MDGGTAKDGYGARIQTYREEVSQKIAEMVGKGTAPWQSLQRYHAWDEGRGCALPLNPVSGERYKGAAALWLDAQGRDDPRWMTAPQAAELGGKVRAGEKPVHVERWTWREAGALPEGSAGPELSLAPLDRPKLVLAEVYNGEQIEGLEPCAAPERDAGVAGGMRKVIENSGVPVSEDVWDLGNAHYDRYSGDAHMPERADAGREYDDVGLRLAARATGHVSRLARRSGPHGTKAAAREDLRVEMACCLTSRELGAGHRPVWTSKDGVKAMDGVHNANMAAKLLRDDPHELFRAAAEAEDMRTWIVEPQARPALARQTRERLAAAGYEQDGPVGAQGSRETRHYLSVPYAEKDAAKVAGAIWDRAAKSWYVPESAGLGKVAAWDTVSGKAPERTVVPPHDEFAHACQERGLLINGHPEMNGKWRRVRVKGDEGCNTSGLYRGYLTGRPRGQISNFRDGGTTKWVACGWIAEPERLRGLETTVPSAGAVSQADKAPEKLAPAAGKTPERERGSEKESGGAEIDF